MRADGKRTLKHQVPGGEVQTRVTAAEYSHVCVAWGRPWGATEDCWLILSWHGSEKLAAAKAQTSLSRGWSRAFSEAVNHGEREEA